MAKEKMDIVKKKCITPEFRVSFPHVFEANSYQGQAPKYKLTMLFDKKTDLKELRRAVHNATIEEFGSDKTKWPKNLKSPFRDGDEKEDMQGYAGTIFVSSTSKQRPGVVDQKRAPITKEDQTFYAGCYARASLIAFYYDTAGNKGVSFALQNVQKLRDGEQFSGKKRAEDEFDDVSDSADDADNYGDSSDDDMGF
jgi:hypothetical protein